jgi:putative DNA primase/helicase
VLMLNVPYSDPPHLRRLLARLERVRPVGTGWVARCPSHPDTTPSLAIALGRDGRVLLYDHGGQCSVADIVKAVGLTVADLFNSAPVTRGRRWR